MICGSDRADASVIKGVYFVKVKFCCIESQDAAVSEMGEKKRID